MLDPISFMLNHFSIHERGSDAGRAWPACLGWILAVIMGGFAHGQDYGGEYQKKAIHICKLARYVEWPKEKMANGNPLVIGVYGADSVSDQIRDVVGGRRINGREVIVKSCATIQEISGCHILFVSRSEESRLSSILGKVRGDPVLTVGECDSFIAKGGTVNLRVAGTEVVMELHEKNARRSSLRIDPKLNNFGEAMRP